MTGRRIFWLIAAAAMIGSSGCGTTHNIGTRPDGPSVYGGVVFDIEMVGPANSCKGLGVIFGPLDLPFSLVLDTATLPITLLCEIFGWRRSGESPPSTGSLKRE